jgi:hypothetical protein
LKSGRAEERRELNRPPFFPQARNASASLFAQRRIEMPVEIHKRLVQRFFAEVFN